MSTLNREPGLVFRSVGGVASVPSLRVGGDVRAVSVTVDLEKPARRSAAGAESHKGNPS